MDKKYYKKLNKNFEYDYKFLLDRNDIVEIDIIGNIKNIGRNRDFYDIKNIFDSHFLCLNGYYKNNILKSIGAIIVFPSTIEEYLKLIGPKSRNMIKKAKKNNYYIKKNFEYNNYLDDMYEINTSKKIRQGRKMYKSYAKKVTKSNFIYSNNKYYNFFRYGCFIENKLVAVCFPQILNNTIFISHIIGHGKYLTYGIMNLLIYYIVKDMIENYKNIKYFFYINWFSGLSSLTFFKKSMYFRPKLIRFNNIYKKNLLENINLNEYIIDSSISLENKNIIVKNINSETPRIYYKIMAYNGLKFKLEVDFECFNDSIGILFIETIFNNNLKKIIKEKESKKSDFIIFKCPEKSKYINIGLLFKDPKKGQYIKINKIMFFFVA